jgi:hypothetical protein
MRRKHHENLLERHARATRDLNRFEEARAASTPDLESISELEVASPLCVSDALDRLRRFGCVMVRGDDDSRAAVSAYCDLLRRCGYYDRSLPRGGALSALQPDPQEFAFPLHALIAAKFHSLCQEFFGTPLMMSMVGTIGSVRTVSAETLKALVKPHQDAHAVALPVFLTFWTLIEPEGAGAVAPGLRLVVARDGHRRESRDHQVNEQGDVEISSTPRLSFDEYYWAPVMNPGDIVIFDPFICHASLARPDMTQPRTSVDIRIAPFEAACARNFLGPDYGLVLFDGQEMKTPRRFHGEPVQVDYGESKGSPLDQALASAQRLKT